MIKYPSKYSNGKNVSAAQYITETICEHKATKEKKELYYQFWTNKEWAKYYRDQIATANRLVKKYGETPVVRALNNPKAFYIYSLRAPHLIPIIEAEKVIFEAENKEITIDYNRDIKTFNKRVASNNKLSKLKELE